MNSCYNTNTANPFFLLFPSYTPPPFPSRLALF